MSDEFAASAPPEPTSVDHAALAAPGLHEVSAADRAATAQQIADELDGEVVASGDLEATLRRRRAGNVAAARELLDRRASADPADRVREIIDIDALGAVARRLAKADRIVVGTEANMVETVGQRVSGGGLSVHPESIRSAANELVSVRTEVAEVQTELDDLHSSVMDNLIDDQSEYASSRVSEPDESRAQGALGGATKRRIIGVVLMSIGIAIGLGAVLWVAVGIPAVIVVILPIVALWWANKTARVDISDLDDKDVASDNLALISARTDAVFDSVPADENGPGGIPASAGAQLRLVETRLDLARERERSAASNWAELAGNDSDPLDIDRVLRERDPQYFAAIDMIGQTSQARAAAAHARRVRARWNVAWAALRDDPPAPTGAEDAVRELAAAGVTAVKLNTRVGSDADRELAQRALAELPESSPSGPLILTGLVDTLSDDLIDQVAELATTTSVVLLSESE